MSEPFVCGADVCAQGLIHLDMPRQRYQAIVKARFAETRVDIEVRERKSKRSTRANSALHAGLVEMTDGRITSVGLSLEHATAAK